MRPVLASFLEAFAFRRSRSRKKRPTPGDAERFPRSKPGQALSGYENRR